MKIIAGLVAALTLTSTSVLAHPALTSHAHPHDTVQAYLGLDVALAVGAVIATGLVALMAARRGQ